MRRWLLAVALAGCTSAASVDRMPESVMAVLTTEPWFTLACGPWPDDWPECQKLKRRMESK